MISCWLRLARDGWVGKAHNAVIRNCYGEGRLAVLRTPQVWERGR